MFNPTSKRAIKKTAKATGDLIGNKIANKITKISRTAQQIIQRMIKKYLKKDIYLQKKSRKLLIKLNILQWNSYFLLFNFTLLWTMLQASIRLL